MADAFSWVFPRMYRHSVRFALSVGPVFKIARSRPASFNTTTCASPVILHSRLGTTGCRSSHALRLSGGR